MEWNDEAIVLSVRRHGEGSAVAHLLTRNHGRHAGFVRGGAGKEGRGTLQPGNEVTAWWRGRLVEQLGHFRCELTHAHAAMVLDDAGRLCCLGAACAVTDTVLPERDPNEAAYAGLAALLDALPGAEWPAAYVRWELALLGALGFGLDLAACAASGVTENLAYVSPRSGRAVSARAGAPYSERLLPLPGFLRDGGPAATADVAAGLRLTGHFLHHHVLAPQNAAMPAARLRLVDRFRP